MSENATKNPGWTEVPDEKGQGYYELQITEGNNETQKQRVKAIRGRIRNYIDLKLATDPIVVVRYGERGMCAMRVNQSLLDVKRISRLGNDRWNTPWHVALNPEDFSKEILVCSLPKKSNVIELMAQTQSGLPFTAIVSFHPSRRR